jgi:hypothetical protein
MVEQWQFQWHEYFEKIRRIALDMYHPSNTTSSIKCEEKPLIKGMITGEKEK